MWKYPLTSDKNGYVPLEDALQWCNMSFYDGFIAAFCESPEDYEAINTEDRIALVLAAIERNAILRRETPTQPDFIGGGGTESITLILYRLLLGVVEPLRGGVAV